MKVIKKGSEFPSSGCEVIKITKDGVRYTKPTGKGGHTIEFMTKEDVEETLRVSLKA